MYINSHIENNQNLTPYLSRLESLLRTDEFIAKLRADEQLDPENFKIRETWLRIEDWMGEYMVIFGRHFLIRAWQRIWMVDDIIKAVMRQLSNNAILEAVTSHPLYWEDGKIVGNDGDEIKSVAVIEEDVPFVCIYECGQSYVYPRTILQKSPDMFFYSNTAVVVVDKDGTISYK